MGGVAGGAGGVLGGGGGGTSNPGSEPRNLTLTNTFPCPVVIYNLTLPEEARKHFEVSGCSISMADKLPPLSVHLLDWVYGFGFGWRAGQSMNWPFRGL